MKAQLTMNSGSHTTVDASSSEKDKKSTQGELPVGDVDSLEFTNQALYILYTFVYEILPITGMFIPYQPMVRFR